MYRHTVVRVMSLLFAVGLPLFAIVGTVYAAPEGTGQVENFLQSVIKVVVGFAGLVATLFFVFGGFTYITSTGNPEKMDKAKRTLLWAAVGLAVCVGAFVLSNIVNELAADSFGG